MSECTKSYFGWSAYLARVKDETMTKVSTVIFVSYAECDQQNTLVSHVNVISG